MTKKILDLSLSIFIITCALAIWIGLFSAKATLEHYIALADQAKQAQEDMIRVGKEVQDVLFEAGFATAVIALSDKRIIPPTDAEKMITDSVDKIRSHSNRLGMLARYINDYRIEHQRR